MASENATEPQFLYKWSSEDTAAFITARVENEAAFTGHKNSAVNGWKKVLQKIGLDGKVTAQQARKKWDNLKQKYKELKNPPTGSGVDKGEDTAASWPWFTLMDEALGQRHSITPPVMRASMPLASSSSSEPGPSNSSPLPLNEDGQSVNVQQRQRRRGRKRSLLDVLREDMAREEAREQARQRAADERANRIINLLETLVKRN